jgi:two-component system sensor histidine kinase/response regulator
MQAFGEAVPEISRVAQRQEQEADTLKHIQGAQLLLVEDNEINQQVAKEILAGGGLNVTVANDGQEAVNVVKDSHFDVVLMDIQMPVMDGYTATRKIREWQLKAHSSKLKAAKSSELSASNLEPLTTNLPIIAMTAHAMSGDEQKSLEAGMNDHITKPIDTVQLFATLQKWIKPAADRAAVSKNLPSSGPAVIDTPAEPDQTIPNDDGLPESLPGFDLAAGLSRLMGNKRLYRKLLLDFGAKYGAVANEIREALDADDFNNAHSLIHNLKGLAGNLEATDLQAASVALEKLVKGQTQAATPGKGLDQTFLKLENALNQALEAARSLAPTTENQGPGSSEKVKASIPSDLIKPLIEPIKAAADMGDVTQIISIAEELKSKADSMAPLCDSLIKLAEDFDLDGIKNLMVELDN